MRRILCSFVVGLAAALSVAWVAGAQVGGKVARIGVLWGGTPSFATTYLEAGRQAMRELGYVEGRDFVAELRFAERQAELLSNLAADLVRSQVDVIVAVGDPAVQAARQATSTVPIVMLAVGDAVGAGFVTSLAKPGGNVTGLGALSVELSGKRLELLKQAVPRLQRVAVLWNPNNPAGILGFRETEVTARALNMTVHSLAVRTAAEIEPAFANMTHGRDQGLIVVTDPLTWVNRRQIIESAARSKLPAIYELREYVDVGGLMSYGPSLHTMVRRVAVFVDKILRGVKPADLPVEQPTQLELVVNLKTASALGFTMPQTVLVRADHVVK